MIIYQAHKIIYPLGMMVGPWVVFHIILAWSFGFYYVFRESLRKKDINLDHMLKIFLIFILGAIIGERLMAFLVPGGCITGSLAERMAMMFEVGREGMSSMGGLLGFLFVLIYTRMKKLRFLKYVDVIAPILLLGAFIARLGCYIAGCCYGSITEVPWAIIRNGAAIHPSQLYHSLANLIAFCIVLYMVMRKERLGRFDGYVLIWTIMLYCAGRFITGFFRGDHPVSEYVFVFSEIQIAVAVTLAALAILMLILSGRDHRKRSASCGEERILLRPSTYAIIIGGGLASITGAYITTPFPYVGSGIIAFGLLIVGLGIRSISGTGRVMVKTKN
ncbi:MAG: prolipoprotein diacylglyceryl transferase [Candidatus Woesearchaeota archaeon]